jgi:hypothetical protein
MSNIERIIIGLLGGFSAVLVKFLGQDFSTIHNNWMNLPPEQLVYYEVGYIILTPILMFLGAVIAWASTDETKRLKLMAIAVAAPAIITTWSGGNKYHSDPEIGSAIYNATPVESRTINESAPSVGLLNITEFLQATSAHAIESENRSESVAKKVEQPTTLETIKRGVGVFFGYGRDPKRYWVIVGSYKDRNDALTFAAKINQEAPELNAWVGAKIPPNEYYPVIVGSYNFFSDADNLRQRALETNTISDAYLSPGAMR